MEIIMAIKKQQMHKLLDMLKRDERAIRLYIHVVDKSTLKELQVYKNLYMYITEITDNEVFMVDKENKRMSSFTINQIHSIIFTQTASNIMKITKYIKVV